MNHRAKFDAVSFILAGEIRNRTNTQKQTNEIQTVNDISTPCLSACVDDKRRLTETQICKCAVLNALDKVFRKYT